ncbi:MAG: hypothetical protein WA667_01670 [Candidatus Nitrosopolaris sp.]
MLREDTSGERIGVNALDEYYNSRKIKGSSEARTVSAAAAQINPTLTSDIHADQFEKYQIQKEQLTGTIVEYRPLSALNRACKIDPTFLQPIQHCWQDWRIVSFLACNPCIEYY